MNRIIKYLRNVGNQIDPTDNVILNMRANTIVISSLPPTYKMLSFLRPRSTTISCTSSSSFFPFFSPSSKQWLSSLSKNKKREKKILDSHSSAQSHASV